MSRYGRSLPAVKPNGGIFDGAPLAWWDDFANIVQTGDPELAARVHATACICGGADDPTWGLYGQRWSVVNAGKRIGQLHDLGIKALTWIEGFGTAGLCYIAEPRRDDRGEWLKRAGQPDLTDLFHIHWNWQDYGGEGEIRWIGAHNYFDDEDFARPYTRTHPRYGCPPMTYPDGRVAAGYLGDPSDPRTSAIYDAGCSKSVLGEVACEYDYHEPVNRTDPATGQPRGPLTGLIDTGERVGGTPDPGFTPEEWARLKRRGYSGAVSFCKDTACPVWIDYARASVRQAVDAGIDGLWVDNFSPWDSFGGQPMLRAFGEWSVAGFRPYLRAHFDADELAAMGVDDAAAFDVRSYMLDRCRQWGGDPTRLDDPRWSDPRWLDDPIWRAYLIYKRQTGTAALSALYRAIKEVAAEEGKPDFLVSGNDTPGYSLGWVRGDLDMVSTEQSWGWALTAGPRGLMPPPVGSYVPVYKLGREHARSRFVNAWMYRLEDEPTPPGLSRVLYYQALANHASPAPNYGGRTIGDEVTDAEFHAFVRRVAPELGARVPVEDVGLYYSSSSQIIEMLPGGFRNHADQPHSFAFYGWATALTRLHVQWRAIPEWKLTPETLAPLRLLIVAESPVFPAEDVPVLEAWVRAGGRLIVTGQSGARTGEAGNFERAPDGSTLSPLISAPEGVRYLEADPGRFFYMADAERPARLEPIAEALAASLEGLEPLLVTADGMAWEVGLSTFTDGRRLFVDVSNTDIDLPTDAVTPTPALTFTVALPEGLGTGELRARALTPGADVPVSVRRLPDGRAEVSVGSVEVYACVVIEAG